MNATKFCFVVLTFFLSVTKEVAGEEKSIYETFPRVIQKFKVRVFNGERVSRGKLGAIGIYGTETLIETSIRNGRKVNVSEMKSLLQCAPGVERELDGNRGGYKLLKLAPPTKEAIENVCAKLEHICDEWLECKENADKVKEGSTLLPQRPWGTSLFRIMDNKLYYDWPWDLNRFRESGLFRPGYVTSGALIAVEAVLKTVNIRNSVFFFEGEEAKMPFDYPVPSFSHSPALHTSSFPLPWPQSVKSERAKYQEAVEANDFSDAFYTSHHSVWSDRIPKCAFFGDVLRGRRIVFDQAVLRPDLLDVHGKIHEKLSPWNPLSDEQTYYSDGWGDKGGFGKRFPHRDRPGFNQFVFNLTQAKPHKPSQFKYLLVMAGDHAASSRLNQFLAHSGAVILLQETEYQYHFSSELKPWVHYVPIGYNGADLTEKVEWLRANDDLAQQLAENAANFGKSYLRMEDYYCYTANALDLVADAVHPSALEPFNATLL